MKKFAFVFPGQGSQSIGMLKDFADNYPLVGEHFERAQHVLGYDLWDIIQRGPESRLNSTAITQPAMLVAAFCAWQIWRLENPKPNMLAGHSLGEYTALLAAEVLSFEDAVKLVSKRGELMQQAVPENEGAMAAIIGLEQEEVIEVCKQQAMQDVLQAVNFNCPGQTVIAGHKAAVQRAIQAAQQQNAHMATLLPVSAPCHSELMQPAADKLAKVLSEIEFNPPKITIIHNYDVKSHHNTDELKSTMVKQLYNPVRWIETINKFVENNIEIVFECGPGKVLSGLNRRINRDIKAQPIQDCDTYAKAVLQLT